MNMAVKENVIEKRILLCTNHTYMHLIVLSALHSITATLFYYTFKNRALKKFHLVVQDK